MDSGTSQGRAGTSAPPAPAVGDLVTKGALKAEYGLTERLIGMLGPPDLTRQNPHYQRAAPMQLYQRERVERWIAANQSLLAASDKRKAASQKAVATKEERSRQEVAALVRDLQIGKVRKKRLHREAAESYRLRYDYWNGEVTERALCSYIRHNYTNYEEILRAIHGKVGAGRLYSAAKLLLCAEIIRVYRLDLDPAVAAFGADSKTAADEDDADPVQAARELLGLVDCKASVVRLTETELAGEETLD